MNELIQDRNMVKPVYTCHCRFILKMNGFQYLAPAELPSTGQYEQGLSDDESDMP